MGMSIRLFVPFLTSHEVIYLLDNKRNYLLTAYSLYFQILKIVRSRKNLGLGLSHII